MHTQIKTLKELIGKTIAGITPTTYESSTLLIVFTDKTMAVLGSYAGYDAEDHAVRMEEDKIDLLEFPRDEVIASGAATTEELDLLYAEQEQIKKHHEEAWERREYERLKQKFEK